MSDSRFPRKLYAYSDLIGVFGIQVGLVSYTFPITGLWSQDPLFFSDAARHWQRIVLGVALALEGKFTGYDPFFAAGSLAGLQDNPAAKIPTLMAVILHPWINEIAAWKIYAFGAALLGPLSVPLALRCLNLTKPPMIFWGSFLGIVIWWASMFRWFHTNGLVSFVLAAFFSLPFFSFVVAFLRDKAGWPLLLGLGAAGALGMFCHPLFPIPIMIGTIIYLILNPSREIIGKVFQLSIVPILSLLANSWWLYPLFFGEKPSSQLIFAYQRAVDFSKILRELLGIWDDVSDGSKVYAMIFLASVYAIAKTVLPRHRQVIYCYGATALTLTFLAHLGGAIDLVGKYEPNRWAPVAYVFLIIPAAIGINQMTESVRHSPSPFHNTATFASIALIGLMAIVNINEVRREVSYENIGHYGKRPPEVEPLGSYTRWVEKWLMNETTTEGRVLFELSKARIYDGSRIAGYLALTIGREFIGGPYPFMHFANFWDGQLFTRSIESIDYKEFKGYSDRYNIKWVLVHSETSKRYFDRMPGAHVLGEFKALKAYRLEKAGSYFLVGQGKVQKRTINKIVLTDVRGDTVILKYHFFAGLKSSPPLQLDPVLIGDDPVPFIKIKNPPKTLTLFL